MRRTNANMRSRARASGLITSCVFLEHAWRRKREHKPILREQVNVSVLSKFMLKIIINFIIKNYTLHKLNKVSSSLRHQLVFKLRQLYYNALTIHCVWQEYQLAWTTPIYSYSYSALPKSVHIFRSRLCTSRYEINIEFLVFYGYCHKYFICKVPVPNCIWTDNKLQCKQSYCTELSAINCPR